ncbi:MAG: hypothetical protein QXP04_04730 [Candidatus Nanoarchaeia archaeon]|nr:hypothetical protein [Candidatus Jingweiarchaeum tengchongense]
MKSRKTCETALSVVPSTGDISDEFYARINSILETSRNNIVTTVNREIVRVYWLIGKEIVEEEQKGKNRAE